MGTLVCMSFQGSILIIVIILLRKFVLDFADKRCFRLLWEIAFVRLFLPDSIFQSFKKASKGTLGYRINGLDVFLKYNSCKLDWLIWIWGIGFVATAFVLLLSHRREMRKIHMSLPITDQGLLQWMENYRLQRKIRLLYSDQVCTPLTIGIIRPVIVLPSCFHDFSSSEWEDMLLHEWIHIRNFDVAKMWMAFGAVCLHWFNPLVWILRELYSRELEECCDEAVIRIRGNEHKKHYALLLLHMVQWQKKAFSLCSYFGKSELILEERINQIMKIKYRKKGRYISSIAIMAVTVCVFFSSIHMDGVSYESYDHFKRLLDGGMIICERADLDFDEYDNLGKEEMQYIELLEKEAKELNRIQKMFICDKVTVVGGIPKEVEKSE